jgi:hypothetical protein
VWPQARPRHCLPTRKATCTTMVTAAQQGPSRTRCRVTVWTQVTTRTQLRDSDTGLHWYNNDLRAPLRNAGNRGHCKNTILRNNNLEWINATMVIIFLILLLNALGRQWHNVLRDVARKTPLECQYTSKCTLTAVLFKWLTLTVQDDPVYCKPQRSLHKNVNTYLANYNYGVQSSSATMA